MGKIVNIHVKIIDDFEYGVMRPTTAEDLGNGLYRIRPIPEYEAVQETWEFVPGTVVRGELKTGQSGDTYFAAVERV